MMRFVSELQETLRERSITIQYNFFASYHGHNACDGKANDAKRQIKNFQLATDIPVGNQHDVIVQLQALNSNIATEAVVIDGKPPKVKTFNGISK
eukprot:CAMPEP_0117083688 /NCGR_PEP_ID=MMETSP0472-20121206/58915_1 /TAXON_ID=693140 ORGANISM="Tiarina fusus, Strain LIS" /NCGR_SAMPLE_ID=MMETSP0472 /ASSEMBLY_ACC=CAM_ASM_000603 /LENGTH=94 /DNA_ID=CAMNT_0004812401 /DNA_START=1211 /DNA_END=1492 /DNA_ORIENTATION=-